MGSRLLKTLATELQYALEVFQEACQFSHCGPCLRQRRIKSLITQARRAANQPEQIPASQLTVLQD